MSKSDTTSVIVVLITAPPKDARRLASQLVEERLAACVNVVPKVESFYCWEEAVQHDDEALLICKTVESQFDKLKAFVKEHHPYDLPEIIALPVATGLPEYLAWVGKETGEK